MPEQASWPLSLILSQKIMKLRTFTNLNKRRKSTFPKEVTITIRSTTEPTRSRMLPSLLKEKTVPDTTNNDATKQSLISFSNMRRIKELQRAMKIQKGTTPKTSPTTKTSCNPVTPSIKDSSTKMLNRTSQITKQRQTRPRPSKSNRIGNQSQQHWQKEDG